MNILCCILRMARVGHEDSPMLHMGGFRFSGAVDAHTPRNMAQIFLTFTLDYGGGASSYFCHYSYTSAMMYDILSACMRTVNACT